MRIYLSLPTPIDIPPCDKDEHIVEVYSSEGLYVVTERGIFRHNHNGSTPATHHALGLVDRNEYPLVKVHQLPLGHKRQLRVTSKIQGRVKLVVRRSINVMVDAYVETAETDPDMVAGDIALLFSSP